MARSQHRRQVDAPPAGRTSVVIQAEITQLEAERDEAARSIADLEARRENILKAGTEADLERHDAEIARTKRLVERAIARRPDLVEALAAARRWEEADRVEAGRAEAEAAVAAVLARVDADYRAPAAKIAAFLRDWTNANKLARDVGLDTADDRLRRRAAKRHPDREEPVIMYLDETGAESSNPYPPGHFAIDPTSGDRFTVSEDGRRRLAKIPPRPMRATTRIVPGRVEPGIWMGHLSGLVNLPAAGIGDAPFHAASELMEREDPRAGPRRSR